MLGQLLEFSVTTAEIPEALQFFRQLGFVELPAGDIIESPYGVIWDGSIALGLHDRELDSPALSFVRPDLEQHLRGLKRLGIELEHAELADDQFNQAYFRDPDGQLVVLLEARTFSSSTWDSSNVPACGSFLEYSLAVRSLEASLAFWQGLGLISVAAGEEPHRWERLRGAGLTLGLHETAVFTALLSFEVTELEARAAYLDAKGLSLRRPGPFALPGKLSVMLQVPVGPPICLVETG